MSGWNSLECAGLHDGSDVCESCCEHQELDHTTCAECGKDMSDDLSARAEWAMECASGE